MTDPASPAVPLRYDLSGNSRHEGLRRRLHRELGAIDFLELDRLEEVDRKSRLEQLAARVLTESETRLERADEERLVAELLHHAFDLGPLTPLVLDDDVADILVNGSRQVWAERLGRLELTTVTFRDEAHLRQIVERILARVGRRIDEASPIADARLPDGARVHAVIPPAALQGSILSIRRFRRRGFSTDELLARGTLTPEIAAFLIAAVRARFNIVITGTIGSGKTTLLDFLCGHLSDEERIVTIEDAAELSLRQPHVVRLEIQPPDLAGKGEVARRDLVRNALRMRADRIVVGEIRGDEALDLLLAMNAGHDGWITTVHANGPREALRRLENLARMAAPAPPEDAVREQVASAFQIVVHLCRFPDGSRRVVSVQEVREMDSGGVTMREIFRFARNGNGDSPGRHEITGIVPRSLERLRAAGLNAEIFTPRGRNGV